MKKKYKVDMYDYSTYKAAKEIAFPVLVIHDKNETEVPVTAGINIHQHLKNGQLVLTIKYIDNFQLPPALAQCH